MTGPHPRVWATATDELDPVSNLIGHAVARHFSDATGRTEHEPEAGDLDLAFSINRALTAAGWGDLRFLARAFTDKARAHDSIADRWSTEDREQALIDSGTAAGYRGAAELAIKPLGTQPASLSAVLALHSPVRRYQASSLDRITYPTAERAYQMNWNDRMRGYESIALGRAEDAPFIEVCTECSRVENSFDLGGDRYPDDHDDEQDGTELSMEASRWPCATYAAIAGV
ncbi:hypothetical protein IV500_05045 [Paeniglutamicibacter antarcticus]|uniref:Uncharacterized protein n=1 Tax=Arthrobacter terrae TaxID=2935737 RepID=A0A931CMB6_9MICC|nr:hypothetical protein [Arthrobacter terrae]MBG0738785.1 hypothetical protein [Arthrobacter terrae]